MKPKPRPKPERPDAVFDQMLQHERTALAWERTAIATIVAGALLARLAIEVHPALAAVGIGYLLIGAGLLVWAGHHYDQLHGPLRRGESPVHPRSVRLVGRTTVALTGTSAGIAVLATTL